MLDSLSSWLTPTTLFLLLNIVIDTIYLISRLPSSGRPHNHQSRSHYHQPDPLFHQSGSSFGAPPLARAPSLLERVKSVDLNFYKFAHHHDASYGHPEQQQYTPSPQSKPQRMVRIMRTAPVLLPSSVLRRLGADSRPRLSESRASPRSANQTHRDSRPIQLVLRLISPLRGLIREEIGGIRGGGSTIGI